jgi:hypothetical protein
MTGPIIVAEWRKNGREVLRIRLDTYQGRAVIDCRSWYAGSDGTLKPGRGGLTVSIRHLPALAESIATALATAKAEGLLESNSE